MKAHFVSRTAQYRAFFRALETVRPHNKRLFSDPYAISFLDNGLKLAVRISTFPLIGWFIPKIIQYKDPGALSSGIARTKHIDDLLEKTVRNGVKQIIILGAGFDTRALRLDFLKTIPVIEIGHPGTSKFKLNKLEKMLGKLPQNVNYLQIDFNKQSLDDLATEHNINFNIPTTIVWEGVTNYLTQQAIDDTFKFIAKFKKSPHIIFTYINKLVLDDPQSFIGTEKLFKNLEKNKEDWIFGFQPEGLPGYLSQFNLTLLEDLGADEYRAEYMSDRKNISKGYEFYRVAYAKARGAYEGWCRRIDLNFRAKYPHLNTKIFKIDDHKYMIYVQESISNFSEIAKDFDYSIRFVTVPVQLINTKPEIYEQEIEGIPDSQIPSKFEGLPLTLYQMANHIACTHPQLDVCSIKENQAQRKIVVELAGKNSEESKNKLHKTLDNLKAPYSIEVVDGGDKGVVSKPTNEIFNIASSKSKKVLNCPFLERDEKLWFENIDAIYSGKFSKEDLYFFNAKKTSCLVNFSMFRNANLRNHILLYDVVYCILPLAENMKSFLDVQKISKDEILYLIQHGRLKILNIQPEDRLDYGFINEAFKTNQSSVISRRAISALCAIDLVDINRFYIFNDIGLRDIIFPLISELSEITKKPVETIANFLLWPKHALRASFDTLNDSGPMAIARYGVNKPIVDNFISHDNKKAIEFEFTFHSSQIHLAHALDATYFPFFADDTKYTDQPFTLMMGNMLNFFKTTNYQNLSEARDLHVLKQNGNPTIQLVRTFDVDDYISIKDFEKEISSAVIRKGLNSLFSELSTLDETNRSKRINEYNVEIERVLNKKNVINTLLDLGKDVAGIPLLDTGIKLLTALNNKAMDKFPALRSVSEYIENKTYNKNQHKRTISLLTRINRVARLKKKHD